MSKRNPKQETPSKRNAKRRFSDLIISEENILPRQSPTLQAISMATIRLHELITSRNRDDSDVCAMVDQLHAGADVNELIAKEQSIIHYLIQHDPPEIFDNSIKIFNCILQYGFDVNSVDESKMNLLECVLRRNQFNYYELLVSHNANTEFRNKVSPGLTRMDCFQKYSSEDMLKVIRSGYINVDFQGYDGDTVLDAAIRKKKYDLIVKLLEYNIELDIWREQFKDILATLQYYDNADHQTLSQLVYHMHKRNEEYAQKLLMREEFGLLQKFTDELYLMKHIVLSYETENRITYYELVMMDINTDTIYNLIDNPVDPLFNEKQTSNIFPLFYKIIRNKLKIIKERIDEIQQFEKKTRVSDTLKQLYSSEFAEIYRKLICTFLSTGSTNNIINQKVFVY